MSLNKNLEAKIEVVDGLVSEMRKHRDQAQIFQAAANALQALNDEIKAVNEQFTGLNSDEIHKRLKAIENQRDGIRDQLAEFKGEFKGLVDGLSGRVGTLKDDVSGLQSLVRSIESSNRERLKAMDGRIDSLFSVLSASEKEVASKIGESSQQTKDLIEKADSNSRNHISEINKETLDQLKEGSHEMQAIITEHFKMVKKWVVFIAVVGVIVAGVAGYLLFLALETAPAN